MTVLVNAGVGVVRALARGVSTLSFGDLGVFGGAVGALTGDLLRVRRAHVESAMARAGVEDPVASARAMYACLGTSALEVLWLAGGDRDLSGVARFDPEARRVLTHGSGVVLAASHTGNWDIASCAVAQRAPLLVVTKHLSVGWLDAFWQSSRRRYGVALTSARGAFDRARVHLRDGGLVAMMIDQVPLRRAHAMELPFLGAEAWVDRAAATLAARSGALFAVPAARRLADGTQEIVILDVMQPNKTRAWIDRATERATGALDAFVRANPTEWLWMHRRWKRPPV
jgi:KDO2-lipid IV(A) lauroyltransferase